MLIMKKLHRLILLITTAITISACGDEGGGALTCNIPCIDSAVTASPSTIDSASGATVTVSFHLDGNISEVNNVSILLAGSDPLNPVEAIGAGVVLNPTSNDISVDITVDSGKAAGSYYPFISVTSNTENTGANYYIDPTKSSSSYTYTEVLGGISGTAQLSSISIPTITVQ